VLCAGILYGNGERIFYEHFKRSWLQDPPKLPYIDKGDNLVPTIHVVDLSRLVRRIINKMPDMHYIFAIDRTKKSTQKSIVESISKGIGTGETESVTLDAVKNQEWAEFLNINLKMRVSEAFKDDEAVEGEEAAEEDEEEAAKKRRFPWHSEEGIASNIDTLNTELNAKRGLKPVKIFITGPPAAGKSFYSE
jgi:adenylate kinase